MESNHVAKLNTSKTNGVGNSWRCFLFKGHECNVCMDQKPGSCDIFIYLFMYLEMLVYVALDIVD